jgi:hypothetical protein
MSRPKWKSIPDEFVMSLEDADTYKLIGMPPTPIVRPALNVPLKATLLV